MDPNEHQLKKQIKLDLDKVPLSSLESVAGFIKSIIKPNNAKTNQEDVSLYGCMKTNLNDDSIDQAIKQSRTEMVNDLEKRVSRWTT